MELGPGAGLTFEEGPLVARMAEEAGADALEIAAMLWGVIPQIPPPTAEGPGGLLPFMDGLKKAVTIPIIAAGRITPELGEKALQDGQGGPHRHGEGADRRPGVAPEGGVRQAG